MKILNLSFAILLMFYFPANAWTYMKMSRVGEDYVKSMDFAPHKHFDFDSDGVKDNVICGDPVNSNLITIRSGKTNKIIFQWNSLAKWRNNNRDRRIMTSCDVVMLTYNTPAVVVATKWLIPGWRAPAAQFVAYRGKSDKFTVRTMTYGQGENKKTYFATARGVQCHPYPEKLVKKRTYLRPGGLCFFAAYEWGLKTHTALFKLELDKDKNLISRDITGSSFLGPWKGGASGTHGDDIPRTRKCNSDTKTWDGLFMMDGTFLDADKDGLPDLITVGQHSSMRFHKMEEDLSKPQGITFRNTTITPSGKGNPQEWLRVTALENEDSNFGSQCVYASGEYSSSNYCEREMRDQMYCYWNGQWERRDLPGPYFSSGYNRPETRKKNRDNLVIKARQVIPGPAKNVYIRIPR